MCPKMINFKRILCSFFLFDCFNSICKFVTFIVYDFESD